MSMNFDTAILKLLPELTHSEFTLLMALSQASSEGVIARHGYISALQKAGLSERQAQRILSGLALHNLAHLSEPQDQRREILTVRGSEE